jgi:hypothetical protein
MTLGGKRGNPKAGFPLFPPSLEIAPRFPHSHRHDYGFILVQAINYTPLNCHPCCRAKVLPMSPAAPWRERFGLQPLHPQESLSGFHEKAGRCQGNTVESLPGWPLAE